MFILKIEFYAPKWPQGGVVKLANASNLFIFGAKIQIFEILANEVFIAFLDLKSIFSLVKIELELKIDVPVNTVRH